MAASGKTVKRYTPQEYYSLEREAEYKSNYYDGEIFAMPDDSIAHSAICTNVIGEIGNRLKGKPCAIYESNLRLNVHSSGFRCYPDASVFCRPLERDEQDPSGETLTNPTCLFEVLSPSTEAYDRGYKAENYRSIPSLQSYVLISQLAPAVEIYSRQSDGSWLMRESKGMDTALSIRAINVELPLAEIYDRVEFTVLESNGPFPQIRTPRG